MIENKVSFFGRLTPILAPSELLQVELAYLLAKDKHKYQQRRDEKDAQGNPLRYFEHPKRVAIILMDEHGIFEPNFIKAALGHDLLEDTNISPELLEYCFGTISTRWIKMLSKVPKEGYYDRLKMFGTWEAMFIKLCDRLDNLRSIGESRESIQKQIDDTERNIYPLAGELLLKAPEGKRLDCHNLAHKIRIKIEDLHNKLKVEQ